MANATGGVRLQVEDPASEMAQALFDLITAACEEAVGDSPTLEQHDDDEKGDDN